MQKYKQEFKNKKFKNEKEFNKWLEEKEYALIEFVDKGQDCIRWHIDEGGEVIHSVWQSRIWNGSIVNLSKLKEKKHIYCFLPNKVETSYDFIVKKVIKK